MPKKNPASEITEPDFSVQKITEEEPKKQITRRKISSDKTQKIQQKINSIYENSDTTLDLPARRSKKAKIFFWTIFFLFFLAAVAWTGFFVFGRSSSFNEDKINISVETDQTPTVGQEFSYQIKIKNQSNVVLNTNSLSIRYPQGFEFISADPVSNGEDDKEWQLGSLNQEQESVINIKGKIWDNATNESVLQIIFSYHPSSYSVELQKIINYKKTLQSPTIDLSAECPTEIQTGTEFSCSLQLSNKTQTNLNSLELSLKSPEGFKNNTPNFKDNKLNINNLPATSSSSFLINLLPTAAAPSGNQIIKLDLNGKNNGKNYLFQTLTKEITLNKSTLSLQVTANGNNEKQLVNFGENVTFLVSYENNGNTALKNVVLKLILDTPSVDNKSLFDWTKITDKADGTITAEQLSPQIRRAIITWDKNQIPSLADLQPQVKNSLEISLPLKNKEAFNLSKLTEFKTTVYSEAILGSKTPSTALQSNTLDLITNSDLGLASQTVFKETTKITGDNNFDAKNFYTLTWNLTNSWHELTDLQITTTLPPNVTWEKSSSAVAGDITYDAATKQIIWKLNRLPTSFPKVSINFDLSLKYNSQNEEEKNNLTEKIKMEAKDKITGEDLLFWKEPLSVTP